MLIRILHYLFIMLIEFETKIIRMKIFSDGYGILKSCLLLLDGIDLRIDFLLMNRLL